MNCLFALWKENPFFSEKKKTSTKVTVVQLLKHGKVKIKGLYSPKTGKTYDTVFLMEDTGGKYVNFRAMRDNIMFINLSQLKFSKTLLHNLAY